MLLQILVSAGKAQRQFEDSGGIMADHYARRRSLVPLALFTLTFIYCNITYSD